MKRVVIVICGLLLVISFYGCSKKRVRTYTEHTQRSDQDLSQGNRGYLLGQPPAIDESARKKTRGIYTVEVDLPPYLEDELKQPSGASSVSTSASVSSESARPIIVEEEVDVVKVETEEASYTEYVVEKNDTLQKISQKLYGTTKNWNKIFEANKDRLKGADKIYPGQTLRIPKL